MYRNPEKNHEGQSRRLNYSVRDVLGQSWRQDGLKGDRETGLDWGKNSNGQKYFMYTTRVARM